MSASAGQAHGTSVTTYEPGAEQACTLVLQVVLA